MEGSRGVIPYRPFYLVFCDLISNVMSYLLFKYLAVPSCCVIHFFCQSKQWLIKKTDDIRL